MSIVHVLKSMKNTTKIIKFLDKRNLFEVNPVTQHSRDAGIVVHESGNVDMQHR